MKQRVKKKRKKHTSMGQYKTQRVKKKRKHASVGQYKTQRVKKKRSIFLWDSMKQRVKKKEAYFCGTVYNTKG